MVIFNSTFLRQARLSMVSGGVDIAFFHYFWWLLCHPNFMGNQKNIGRYWKGGNIQNKQKWVLF